MREDGARELLVRLARSLFERGFTVGSSGNISMKIDTGLLITPTNACLGFLSPDRISQLDDANRHVGGDPPSKEVFLHQAFYETRPGTGAVVHLHSTYATALSCVTDIDPQDCIPPLTPYVVMRVGQVKLLPYVRPGDARMGDMIRCLNGASSAVLLANHGPVVAGASLESAVYAAEELEETAKLTMLLRGHPTRCLSEAQIEEIATVFGYPR